MKQSPTMCVLNKCYCKYFMKVTVRFGSSEMKNAPWRFPTVWEQDLDNILND